MQRKERLKKRLHPAQTFKTMSLFGRNDVKTFLLQAAIRFLNRKKNNYVYIYVEIM